jgi:hypothetical protein
LQMNIRAEHSGRKRPCELAAGIIAHRRESCTDRIRQKALCRAWESH